jgi:YD repeat-containing protein
MTRYDYDDESMRLVRLRSEGYTKPNSTTYSPDGTTTHQDFSYTYDGVGNVTQIESSGNNVGIGGTNSLSRTFEYDPLYRLTEATGREYASNPSNPWDYMPAGGNANDPNQTRAYTESYDYDKVGNMKTLTHDYGAGSGTWTRDYVTESTTNRLDQMTSAGGTHQYTYDDAGNLTSENTDRKYEWDARGRMRSFRNQVSGSQASVFAHYTYDGGGQRVQKVVSKDSGNPVHSIYIGGIFEHHERIDGEQSRPMSTTSM